MKKIGFIGYGHMGSMLLHGFIKNRIIIPKQIWLSTRTQQKLLDLRDRYPMINIASHFNASIWELSCFP